MTTIHFDVNTQCQCIKHIQALLSQAQNIILDTTYVNALSTLLVNLVGLINETDEPRVTLYLAEIDNIESLKTQAFDTWRDHYYNQVVEPQVLTDLRNQPPPNPPE